MPNNYSKFTSNNVPRKLRKATRRNTEFLKLISSSHLALFPGNFLETSNVLLNPSAHLKNMTMAEGFLKVDN